MDTFRKLIRYYKRWTYNRGFTTWRTFFQTAPRWTDVTYLESLSVIPVLSHSYVDMECNNSNYSLGNAYVKQEWTQYSRYEFALYAYLGVPLILGGLVGNVIAFCMLGKLVRQNVTTFLLRGLAIVDICALLGHGIGCASYIGIASHPSIAKLAPYVIYIATVNDIVHVVNIWTTVVVGMNRYIALCRPLEATRLYTSSRAGKHLVCIILISIVYRLPTFFNYEIKKTADGSAYREPALRNKQIVLLHLRQWMRCTIYFPDTLLHVGVFLCTYRHCIPGIQKTTTRSPWRPTGRH